MHFLYLCRQQPLISSGKTAVSPIFACGRMITQVLLPHKFLKNKIMEIISDNSSTPRKYKGLISGIILIFIGIVLFGVNFGYIAPGFKNIIFSWPSILILIGIFHMTRRHQIGWGVLWIMGGIFFLFPKIVRNFPDYFPEGLAENFAGAYWPILIIMAGIIVIIHKFVFPENNWTNKWEHHAKKSYAGNYTGKSYQHGPGSFEKNSIFGGGEHIILDPVFKGGEANAIFGGLTIDLRRTSLQEGETKLEVNAIFGGVTLMVPGDWNVETRMDAVFGGFEDKRRIADNIDTTKKLIIVGSCVFGGGEIMG
jgi:predicted membrane protein